MLYDVLSPTIATTPRHFGKLGHPKNGLPALAPFFAYRSTVGVPHLGQGGVGAVGCVAVGSAAGCGGGGAGAAFAGGRGVERGV